MNKSKVKLTICGSDYVVLSEESESYIKAVGDAVNEKIQHILSKNPQLSSSMASILLSLDLYDETYKQSDKINDLKTQLNNYLIKIKDINLKNENLTNELIKSKETIEQLQGTNLNEINNLKDQLNKCTFEIDTYRTKLDNITAENLKLKDELLECRKAIEKLRSEKLNIKNLKYLITQSTLKDEIDENYDKEN